MWPAIGLGLVGCDRGWHNATMDEQTHERIRQVIASVPAGRVASYGDIAAMAGASTPRIVGWVLKEDGADLPWHRIIRADGTVAQHLRTEQLARLRAEGVLAAGQQIDMNRYRWNSGDTA